jgi:hypothetical protein
MAYKLKKKTRKVKPILKSQVSTKCQTFINSCDFSSCPAMPDISSRQVVKFPTQWRASRSKFCFWRESDWCFISGENQSRASEWSRETEIWSIETEIHAGQNHIEDRTRRAQVEDSVGKLKSETQHKIFVIMVEKEGLKKKIRILNATLKNQEYVIIQRANLSSREIWQQNEPQMIALYQRKNKYSKHRLIMQNPFNKQQP